MHMYSPSRSYVSDAPRKYESNFVAELRMMADSSIDRLLDALATTLVKHVRPRRLRCKLVVGPWASVCL